MFLRPETSIRAIWQQRQLAREEEGAAARAEAEAAELARELRLAAVAAAIAVATKAVSACRPVNSKLYYKTK